MFHHMINKKIIDQMFRNAKEALLSAYYADQIPDSLMALRPTKGLWVMGKFFENAL